MTTVFLARWRNTWGEYHGTVGVFTTQEAAVAALDQVEPRSDHLVVPVEVDEVRDDWEDAATWVMPPSVLKRRKVSKR